MLEVLGFAAVSAAILYTPKFCAWLCGWVGLAVASAVIGLFMNFVMSVEAEPESAAGYLAFNLLFSVGFGLFAVFAVLRNALRLKRGVFPIRFGS